MGTYIKYEFNDKSMHKKTIMSNICLTEYYHIIIIVIVMYSTISNTVLIINKYLKHKTNLFVLKTSLCIIMTSHYSLYVKYNNIRKIFKSQQKLFLNYKKITEISLNLS